LNGFRSGRETVENGFEVTPAPNTPLKQGVNESTRYRAWWLMKHAADYSSESVFMRGHAWFSIIG
jgi:hypothetical protein